MGGLVNAGEPSWDVVKSLADEVTRRKVSSLVAQFEETVDETVVRVWKPLDRAWVAVPVCTKVQALAFLPQLQPNRLQGTLHLISVED
jgi:hypothetical protein